MKTTSLALAALVGLVALPRARAFSDPLMFDDITQVGGGGGRFFTGSPFDGYTCAVCHRGGVIPKVRVIGFPTQYVPGTSYEVELRWDEPQVPHALNLELVNRTGQDMHVTLDELERVGADGRCERSAAGELAATLTERGLRRIIGVSNCGAASVRFRFTAPDAPSLAFSAAIVRTDESGDAEGDGVLEIQRVFERAGTASVAYGGTEACSVTARRRSPGAFVILLLGCAAALVRRVQKR